MDLGLTEEQERLVDKESYEIEDIGQIIKWLFEHEIIVAMNTQKIQELEMFQQNRFEDFAAYGSFRQIENNNNIGD